MKHKYPYLSSGRSEGYLCLDVELYAIVLYKELFVFTDLHVEKTEELHVKLSQLSIRGVWRQGWLSAS